LARPRARLPGARPGDRRLSLLRADARSRGPRLDRGRRLPHRRGRRGPGPARRHQQRRAGLGPPAARLLRKPAREPPGVTAWSPWVEGEAAARALAAAEEALLSLLRQAPWKGVDDLLGGLVGLGVYALERLPRPTAAAMVPLVVARLGERAGADGRGLAGDDPGMAHGTAGVIALLARLIRE